MRTRGEQVQAHRFVTRRIVSAVLSGEPETNELPMRRLGTALFASLMVATLVFAGFGVYGLLSKKGAPLEAQTLVIERETGAKYVYTEGKLYPALNFASARLALGSADTKTRTMSQKALQGMPRGMPVGIPDAPDALPERSRLLSLPWQVCQSSSGGVAGGITTHAVLGRELPGAEPLGERGMLIRANGAHHLLWHNTRMSVANASVLAALGLSAVDAPEVTEPLINSITAGPSLRPLRVAGAGTPSTRPVGGQAATVGQIFRAAGQHYVLTLNGLSAIGEITARLALAGGGQAREITPADVGAVLVGGSVEPAGMPPTLPELYSTGDVLPALCVAHRDKSGRMPLQTSIEVFKNPPADLQPADADAVPAQQTARDAVRTVDNVVMTGGRAAVVRAIAGSGEAPGTAVYLVVNGTRYPFGQRNGDAMTALGYGGVTPEPVPAAMLALVPAGPTLDSEAAKKFGASTPVTPQ